MSKLDHLRAAVSESKTPAGIADLTAIVLTLGLVIVVWKESFATATLRYSYWFEVVYVMAMTWILAAQYKKQFQATKKAGGDPKPAIVKMKFWAEIFAAVALFSFFLSFYRLSADLDRANSMGRYMHLTLAATKVKTRICDSHPELKDQCSKINEGFNKAGLALLQDDEKTLVSEIKQLKANAVDVYAANRKESLSWFNEEVGAALVEEDFKLFTIVILNVTLFFASLAISRKIALAWYERPSNIDESGSQAPATATVKR